MSQLGNGNWELGNRAGGLWSAALSAAFALALLVTEPAQAIPQWTSPDHYRVLVTVDPRGVARKNSPASVEIDLAQALANLGASGTLDEDTIEVVAYDASGAPRLFDSSRAGYEQYLLPWRVQRYYGIDRLTLSFVIPNRNCTQYAVYFDTVESGLGKPLRYPGIVGDGDRFREVYERREINACHMDCFADFDGDGDLDLFKGGVEAWIYCYENVGGNRYVDRGVLTSNGQPFKMPCAPSNRSWLSILFHDWDGDGDQDLFASFADGPEKGYIHVWENTTTPGGQIRFADLGRLNTQSGKPLGDGWFGIITVVDWDGDGKQDVLAGREGMIEFHRNIGPASDIHSIQLADGVYLTANGMPIRMGEPRVDCADIDSDGDLDLFCASQMGHIYLFENVGTRTSPVLRTGRVVAFYEAGASHSGVKVADFDGDGLLDFVAGRYWENTHWGEQPRMYGRLYKNVGTPTAPRFEARDAYGGSPYTERFQICDAVRQNGVRSVDWNNDGVPDLVASDTDGFVWFFRNTTKEKWGQTPFSGEGNGVCPHFSLFEPGVKAILSTGQALKVGSGGEYFHGYARIDVADWNNDGRKDLLVADTKAWLWLFPNVNTDADPIFGPGTRLYSGPTIIDGSNRGSVLVCDWDNDGKKDVVFADDVGYYFCENTNTDASPVLAAMKPIKFGGQPATYTRPNLGSYVDWDGDGKKDFIGCEFENSVRLYRNIGTGGFNVEPTFAANANGVTIVAGETVQMISGADAVDWNGDGDIDILTGQGHGGSGLRFFERDWSNDFVNGTWPICSVGSSERGWPISDAKTLGNGAVITVPQAIVSACFDGFFYVQSQYPESSSGLGGIRVVQIDHGRSIGERVDVRGTMETNAAGERYITASSVVVNQ